MGWEEKVKKDWDSEKVHKSMRDQGRNTGVKVLA